RRRRCGSSISRMATAQPRSSSSSVRRGSRILLLSPSFLLRLLNCSCSCFVSCPKFDFPENFPPIERNAGFAGTYESWGPQVKGLTGAMEPVDEEAPAGDDSGAAEGVEVCCYDNRGMGRSS